ncbi:MAG: carbamoyl-phosphate synthase (glutamine-hydrolyzing) large subunit [Planifilum fimeticola]
MVDSAFPSSESSGDPNPGLKSVLVIGSGPIVIGQAAEFDYSGTQACLALREEGIRVILVNNNPATIMTDEEVADVVYSEPLTVDVLTRIIERERPEGLLATMGGQTGLNLAVELKERGVLDAFSVRLLGTPVETIRRGEDREAFKRMMKAIGEPVPESATVSAVEEAVRFAEGIGYPVVVRPAYTLGGFGGGFAEDEASLREIARRGLAASPIRQVLVEKSILGWKEIEYEVMRDSADTCITVCNMENIDPVGVHTGDSMVVAPTQTLSDRMVQRLRSVSCKVIRALKVVGGCNIQFAVHPETDEYAIIEVNPRVSRSSALASKATGYPIARLAAKLAIGYRLDECLNPVTGHTFASFEPALDYVVVKLPRWPFDRFPRGDRKLGTQMKATGEVMALGRNLESALYKAVRSLDMGRFSLIQPFARELSDDRLADRLRHPDDERLFLLAEAFRRGWELEDVRGMTGIAPFFLHKIRSMVQLEEELAEHTWETAPESLLVRAKEWGVADAHLSRLYGVPEREVRRRWERLERGPAYKWVDTCAGEFIAETPYFYSTWKGEDEVVPAEAERRVLVLGSGPIRIGQGIEFDYCSVHAAKALREMGIHSIVINNNPETVSTDYSTADRLYFDPLTVEDVYHVARKERVEGILVQYGGQTAVNLIRGLEEAGLPVLGTSAEVAAAVEDRKRFTDLLLKLDIPHIPGATASTRDEVLPLADRLGYPLLLRPSFVIGGQGMQVVHSREELAEVMDTFDAYSLSEKAFPLLLDRFLEGLEVEVDAVTDGRDVMIPVLIQHVERAGVHSGDSISLLPALDLTANQRDAIVEYTHRIARALPHRGLLNIQFIVQGDEVYCLEVNPRASRTVPVVSKVMGVPMVGWATRVQLGESLRSFAPTGLLPPPDVFAAKGPVFSAAKLPGVDPALGPSMKSTGEVLGLGDSPEEAVAKVLPSVAGSPLPRLGPGVTVGLSVADKAKPDLEGIVPDLLRRGVSLRATPGTARWIADRWGASVGELEPDEWTNWLRGEGAKMVLNIPGSGGDARRSGFRLRQACLGWQVPCFTSIDTFRWVIRTQEADRGHASPLLPLQAINRKERMMR